MEQPLMLAERLITTREAANRFGMSKAWYEKQRWAHTGPPYLKIGGAVPMRSPNFDSGSRISASAHKIKAPKGAFFVVEDRQNGWAF